MRRVDTYLASFVWTRTASHSGQVNVGRHYYQVGSVHADETISVRFVPDRRAFRFEASDGSWVIEHPAIGLDKVDIIGRMPIESAYPLVFQLPLPLEGV